MHNNGGHWKCSPTQIYIFLTFLDLLGRWVKQIAGLPDSRMMRVQHPAAEIEVVVEQRGEAAERRQLTAEGHRTVLQLLRAASTHTQVSRWKLRNPSDWQHAAYVYIQAISKESAICLSVCLPFCLCMCGLLLSPP